MPAVVLSTESLAEGTVLPLANPLPELLQTPAGLAIIEIQGTIHSPLSDSSNGTHAGRLEFPLYDETNVSTKEGLWMKKAYLYIGKHQRLNGEVKKLPKPLAIISKNASIISSSHGSHRSQQERLSILAVVKHKILFSSRPEPVGV